LNEVAKDFGEGFARGGGKREAFAIDWIARGPLREARHDLRAQLARAHPYANFFFVPPAKVASGDDLSIANERDLIASDFDFAQNVGIQKDGCTSVALGADDIAHQAPSHGIEARGGFVQKNDFRIVDERLGQADALEHAFGKTLQALAAMRSEPDEIDKIRDALAQPSGIHAAEPTVKFEKLSRRQPLIKPEIFGQKSYFAPDFYITRRRPENVSFPTAWAHQPQEHFYGSALAGSVGPKEAEDFAAGNTQRQVANGNLVAKNLAQIPRFDGKTIWLTQNILLGNVSISPPEVCLP